MEFLNNILTYSHIFEPIEGYTLHKAVAATYSFDLKFITLLTILTDEQESLTDPSIALLNALKEKKLWVYYQYNRATSGGFNSDIRGAVSHFVAENTVPIQPEENSSFHPKIVLIAYKSKSSNLYLYRLAVLSRNLTLSGSHELGVIMESQISDFDLLDGIAFGETAAFPEEIITFINTEDWHLPSEREIDVQVFYTNNNNKPLYTFMKFDLAENIIAVSPGFSKDIDLLMKHERTKLYYNCDSHAKMYFLERGNGRNELWIGSANCTKSGLGFLAKRNSECMVKLTFRNGKSSADSFVTWLTTNGFKPESWVTAPEYKDQDEDPELDSIMKQISPVAVSASKQENGKYKEVFTFHRPLADCHSGISIHLYGKLSSTVEFDEQKAKDKMEYEFSNLNLIQLTPLLVLVLHKKDKENKNITVTRVIRAEVDHHDTATKALLEQSLHAIKNKLADQFDIIPAVKVRGSEGNQVIDASNRASQSERSKSKDFEYEKLLKYYGSGQNMEHLKNRLEKNKSLIDEEKYEISSAWIRMLQQEDTNI